MSAHVVQSVVSQEHHSCDVCKSAEYKTAQTIIQRSGLRVEQWGYLLHDIARGLIAAKGGH